MSLDRRELLKAGSALIFGGALANTINPAEAYRHSRRQPPEPQPQMVPPGNLLDLKYSYLLSELMTFADKLRQAKIPPTSSGISIPFATYPLAYYMRCPKEIEEAKIPPPDLDGLRNVICDDSGYAAQTELQKITSMLWKEMFPRVAGWEETQELTVRAKGQEKCMKDRVISCKYMVDLAELDNTRLGLFCLLPVFDILTELHTKLRHCWDALLHREHEAGAATVPLATLPMNIHWGPKGSPAQWALMGQGWQQRMQARPPRVWSVQKAYLWEYFVYTEVAGVISNEGWEA